MDKSFESLSSRAEPAPRFRPYLIACFINAFNDNAFKLIVSLVVIRQAESAGIVAFSYAIFIVPFLLFSSWAGAMADRFSKRTVLVVMQAYEVLAMLLAAWAFHSGNLGLLFGALFWSGVQSAFYSPAKYGILPEALDNAELSRANGIQQAVTFVGIVLGTAFGGIVLALFDGDATNASLASAVFAVVGVGFAWRIWNVTPANPSSRVDWFSPFGGVFRTLRRVLPNRSIGAPMAGLAFFWFLGASIQMALLFFSKNYLYHGWPTGIRETHTSVMQAILAIGIGLGSVLAGRWSGRKVELGLVPLGAIGTSIFLLDLGLYARDEIRAGIDLFLLGASAGLFAVPMTAAVQARAPEKEIGAVLAASNFLTFTGILVASPVFYVLEKAGVDPAGIIAVMGALTLAVGVGLCFWLREFFLRFIIWLLTHTIYRIKIIGSEHIPQRGPALLVANHVSFVDALLIGACVQRFIRFLMLQDYYDHPLFNGVCRTMNAIPIATGDTASTREALRKAVDQLKAGHVVCIFAEGSITRTGQLLPFRRGFETVARAAKVPIVPVHLDGVWGSIFSFQGGRVIWKRPRKIPYPVTVSFGEPLPYDASAFAVRQAVAELGAEAMIEQMPSHGSLVDGFLRSVRVRWFQLAAADSAGLRLRFGTLAALGFLFSRKMRKESSSADGSYVGLALPTSVAASIINVAADMGGFVPVNINFTASKEAVAASIAKCRIRRVFTSRKFLEKVEVDFGNAEIVMVEDWLKSIPKWRIGLTELALFTLPLPVLRRAAPARRKRADDVATVIFSSGSTGLPKGVVLTQSNVRANIEGLAQIFDVTPRDRIVGCLPFFHSFGYTVTIWFPLVAGFAAIYHPNPLDPKTIGALTEKHRGTILLATPTFASSYMRKIPPDQFRSLRFTVVGAEKLQPDLAKAWAEKYGSPLLEGYGTTELAPVVSVNLPTQARLGSIGHPIPGVVVRITHPETRQVLETGEEGMLEVKGANVMKEYLDDPGKTAEVIRDGWYVTGDIARIERDGYVRITGRLSRFSKIGGEMVPHGRVEEEILRAIGAVGPVLAVTGVGDAEKGEKLVVLHEIELNADEIVRKLRESGIPNLWIPRKDSFRRIEKMPLLGTGKLDLRRLQEMAAEVG